jgi:ketosteroid isomerase-like protein
VKPALQRGLWALRVLLMACGVAFVALVLAVVLAASGPGAAPERHEDAHPAPPGAVMGDAPPREEVARIFERVFASKDAAALAVHYHPDAVMEDSWARCQGRAAIRNYYAKQFKYADVIRLEVKEVLQQGHRVMLRFRGRQRTKNPALDIDLPGVIYLEFREGKIWYQREYWDGTAFLDDVPLLGRLFRSLRYYLSGAAEPPEPT